MTHRQYEAWQAWLRAEWNRPSRTDHYLMQLNRTLSLLPAWVWGKSPEGPALDKMRIPFVFSSREPDMERQTVGDLLKGKAARSKQWVDSQQWAGRLGGQITVNRISQEEMARLDEMSPDEAARARMAMARKAG